VLIVVTGTDGSGKTTVTTRLMARLGQDGGVTLRRDKWDIYDHASHPSCRFLKGPLDELRSCISAMPVPARTLFLFWSMHMTMRPELLAGADYTILDSYWYKHAASELVYGAPPALVQALAAPLTEPDAVFLLDIDPRDAWLRKQARGLDDVVPYECGMSERLDADAFTSHQSLLRERLGSYARERRWTVLDATLRTESIVDSIVSALRERRALR
jgi:thymidylate kinase